MRYALLGLFSWVKNKKNDILAMHIQVEDIMRPLALACTDMHEASSKHTSTVQFHLVATPLELLVSHCLPTSVQLGPPISISSAEEDIKCEAQICYKRDYNSKHAGRRR